MTDPNCLHKEVIDGICMECFEIVDESATYPGYENPANDPLDEQQLEG